MTEVLLKELSNSDLEWATVTGKQQEIPTDTILMQEGKTADNFYILLEGSLSTTLSSHQFRR
jgi:CRP/FNR family transcriptional regulator, cyclic AMP receptor protein